MLKLARSLQQKKYRELHGCFLVQGPKLVGELLHSGWPIENLYATEEANSRYGYDGAAIVEEHELDRIGTLESGNEVIAVARKQAFTPVVDLGESELVLALDGIGDPGNLGTIVRIADWFGIRRVWCSTGSVDVHNPKCVQASMGAIFRVRVDQLGLAPFLTDQQAKGAKLYLATMGGASVFKESLARKSILVLGSESHGISDDLMRMGGREISIPGNGSAESLNVAMAAAALCTEFSRQRLAP